MDTSAAEDEETNRFGTHYFRENYHEGTIVDETLRQSVENSDETSELEAAMIKRSEIAMRGRSSNSDSKQDALRQSSIAGFPALLMSQTDLNMNSKMN